MSEVEKEKPKKQFAVWQTESEAGFYNHYDSLADAVSENDGEEIFDVTYKSLGHYAVAPKRVRKLRKKN